MVALAFALAACGDDEPSGGDGGGGGAGSDRAAVEKAARDYIVETQSDEDDTETASAITFSDVSVTGDSAEAKAESSSTGNRYEVTLVKSGSAWQGQSVLKNAPSENRSPGGDPNSGSGRSASTDQVEAQIKTRLLGPLKVSGEVECPPRIKLRRGNNFECKVTGERDGVVEVTQKNDQGSLNYKVKFGSAP